MRKFVPYTLVMAMLCFMTACSGSNGAAVEQNSEQASQKELSQDEQQAGGQQEDAKEQNDAEDVTEDGDEAVSSDGALAILESVWSGYTEDEKFPAAGGDFSEENQRMDAPGKYEISNPDELDSALAFPAGSADKIDSAASLVHMMNANTFTGGVYHVKDMSQLDALVEEVTTSIKSRQWTCGIPQKFAIVTVDDYLILTFGKEENVNTFMGKINESYPQSKIAYDEAIQ